MIASPTLQLLFNGHHLAKQPIVLFGFAMQSLPVNRLKRQSDKSLNQLWYRHAVQDWQLFMA